MNKPIPKNNFALTWNEAMIQLVSSSQINNLILIRANSGIDFVYSLKLNRGQIKTVPLISISRRGSQKFKGGFSTTLSSPFCIKNYIKFNPPQYHQFPYPYPHRIPAEAP